MRQGEVTLRLIDPVGIPAEFALSCLTAGEKIRAARFRFREHAVHWTACRAALRQILAKAILCQPQEVPLVLSEFGKPELAPPHNWLHFNLSHCSGLALVALGVDGPVGVDIEPLDRAPSLLECEAAFCHLEEIAALPQERTARALQLLRIWTAKEAVLKALGSGLSHPPEKIRIDFRNQDALAYSDVPIVGIEKQRLLFPIHPRLAEYQAVVSVPSAVNRIEIL